VDLLIGDVFRNAARAVPQRVAVQLGATSRSFADIDRTANRVARRLRSLGIAHGDRVVVRSPTMLDLVPVFAGLAKIGAVFVPVNPGLAEAEHALITHSAQPALVVDDVAELVASAGGEADDDITTDALRETDPHVVFFTSGSSGRSKGAVLSHRVNHLRSHPGALLEPRGAMVCPYPLFHMGAWTIALQQWQARDAVVLVDRADASSIADAVERTQATRLNCIPAVWRRLIDDGVALPSLRFADTGTSATPLELLHAIRRAAPNAHIRVFYGSTEAGSVAALDDADVDRKPGSCGVPAPSMEVRIDEHGELLVRGPLLFDGYLHDPDSTATALAGGWYRTGDLAEIDGEGFLTIVGRAGELIRSGGESVAPAEVEAVLAQHEGVADVAVVGVPEPDWGEMVCAVVVARRGASPPTLDELRAHCAGELAPFKQPRRLVVVEAIPRTAATNQVQRRLLVEQVTALPS
jgi:acyl-CoA synthetase (AMP-forming)/AMP-acid ligase II